MKNIYFLLFILLGIPVFAQDYWEQRDSVNGPAKAVCGSFVILERGFVVGGLDDFGFKRKMYSYNMFQDDWDDEESIGGISGDGLQRGSACSFAIGTKGYVCLGQSETVPYPNIGEKHYKKYMSFLLTVFFFIWFLNIIGLTPLGINATGNITVTACLAIIVFLITNLTANKNYWGHIFWMPGVPTPMKFILAPIELLGVIIKPFSLMIRLYANIFAGHIVLMSLIALMFIFKSWLGSSLSFLLSFAISSIEILVALLQAYIFTMLSALFFGAAVEEHHHEGAEHH